MGSFLESPSIELLIVKSKTKELKIRISKNSQSSGGGGEETHSDRGGRGREN